MNNATLIALYSMAVVASSLLGGWLPSLLRLTHVRMQLMLSFVGGMMLGVGLLHMLPHSYVELGSLDTALVWMLVGLLGMFLLIRTFHFHEHGATAHDAPASGVIKAIPPRPTCDHEQGSGKSQPAGLSHDHSHHARLERPAGSANQNVASPALSSLSWMGVACGLSLHAFLDGVALGAGIISDATHRPETKWAGLGVFLAILLHKPLDALSITTLMRARHWSHRSQQIVNASFAMMCPLGAWAFASWVGGSGSAEHRAVGIALAISAGVFLCISLSDLLPEVQFHRHDRLKLSTALILGVLAAYAIHYFEPPHAHSPGEHIGEHAHEHDVSYSPSHHLGGRGFCRAETVQRLGRSLALPDASPSRTLRRKLGIGPAICEQTQRRRRAGPGRPGSRGERRELVWVWKMRNLGGPSFPGETCRGMVIPLPAQ
jgi:zinc and cadmium transporter